jgi:uncharacterized protein YndB with AHSA1/START domain
MTKASERKTETGQLDLTITRVVDVPRALIWEAWTTPEHLKRWWTPAPWTTPECRIDLRPGGEFYTLMRGPDGAEHAVNGCFLDIVPQERIVFTDVLLAGWRPAATPYPHGPCGPCFTAIVTFEDLNGATKYTARALHKDDADREKHREMGFELGWNAALDQLVDLLKTMGGETK